MDRKHSNLGIASLVINIAVLVMIGLLILVAVVNSPLIARVPVTYYFIFPLVSLIALVLGFLGLFQKDRAKLFPVLGIILSVLITVIFFCLGIVLLISISTTM